MNKINPINKPIGILALATVTILLIPLLAMQFTDEVNWGLADFLIGAFLLFGTGFSFVLLARKAVNLSYRLAAGVALAGALLIIWSNIAVGILGSEDNPANLMFFGVLIIGFIGALAARFQPKGMSRVLFAVAIAQALVPVIALIIWKSNFTASEELIGILQVIIFNGFFVVMFIASALLFRNSAFKQIKA